MPYPNPYQDTGLDTFLSSSYAPIVQGTGTDAGDQYVASRLAFMDKDTEYSDAVEKHLAAVRSMDAPSVAEYSKAMLGGLVAQANEATLRANAALAAMNKPEAIQGAVQEIKQRNDALSSEDAKKLSIEAARMAIEEYGGSTERGKQVALYDLLQSEMASVMEEAGMPTDFKSNKFQFGKQLVTSALFPRTLIQFGLQGKGNPLAGYKEYADSVRSFLQLSGPERLAMWRDVLKWNAELSGNNTFQFQARMKPYLTGQEIDSVKWAAILDGVILPGDLISGLKVIKKMANVTRAAGSPIKLARDMGDLKKAAEISDEALKKADTENRADLAQNMSPFGGENFSPMITSGIAGHTQQIVAKDAQKVHDLAKTLDDIPLRVDHTDEEKTVAKEKYMEQFATEVSVNRNIPREGIAVELADENEVGATFRVTISPPDAKLGNAAVLERLAQQSANIKRVQEVQIERLKELSKVLGNGTVFSNDEEVVGIKMALDNIKENLARIDGQVKAAEKGTVAPEVSYRYIKYTTDDYGRNVATEFSNALAGVNSPNVVIGQMLDGAVSRARAVDLQSAVVKDTLVQMANTGFVGLNKKQRASLNSILLQGDVDRVERYTNEQLADGIVTPDGLIQLKTDRELSAYHTARTMFQTLHRLKEREVRRMLELEGYSHSIDIPGKDQQLISAFVNPRGGLKRLPDDVKRVYSARGRVVEDVGDGSDIAKRISEGEGLVRFKKPVEIDGEYLNYGIIREKDLRPLPDSVLNYRPGYVTQIPKGVFYVAEKTGKAMIDGVLKKGNKTIVRFFDSASDAKKWTAQEIADTGEDITYRRAQELGNIAAAAEREEFEQAIFGGLYTGEKTSKKGIPFGLGGTKVERVGAFEALEAYMNNVSSRLPATDFRMGLVQRFINDATDEVKFGEGGALTEPWNWKSEFKPDLPLSDIAGLKAQREWIKDQLRIPNTEERRWQNLMNRVGESLDRRGGKVSRYLGRSALNLSSKDPVAAMRAAAFHGLLGVFNPVQLYVQAAGASMLFSLNPAMALKNAPRYMALRAAMFSDNPKVWKEWAKAALIDPEHFANIVKDYRRTGLHQATRSTADYAVSMGMHTSALDYRNLADKGLVFYREGERWVRGNAYLMARENLFGKITRSLTTKELDQVLAETNRLTLNLDRSNRAFWQRGILSIPTQFQQMTAKFIENVGYKIGNIEGGWSASEKTRILLGQAALFGAAGVPFGNWAASNILEWAKSEDEYGLAIKDPEVISKITGGFNDWFISQLFGEGITASKRISNLYGVEQFIENFTTDDKTVAEKFAGAIGTMPSRALKAAAYIIPMLHPRVLAIGDWREVPDILNELASISSGYRNLDKMRIWTRLNYIPDSKGKTILDIQQGDMGFRQLMAVGLGLTQQNVEDYYELKKYNLNVENENKAVVDTWINIMNRYKSSEAIKSPKTQERVNVMLGLLTEGMTQERKQVIGKMLSARMSENDHALSREMLKAIQNMMMLHGDTTSTVLGGEFPYVHPSNMGSGNIELNSTLVESNKDK